jgi:hypothetical protein
VYIVNHINRKDINPLVMRKKNHRPVNTDRDL